YSTTRGWHRVLRSGGNIIAMPACIFSFPFSGTPAEILNRAEAAIHDQGGHFQGDETGGAFELTVLGSVISGSYRVSGQELSVTINNKPFMIPCSTIEHYLAKHLETVRV